MYSWFLLVLSFGAPSILAVNLQIDSAFGNEGFSSLKLNGTELIHNAEIQLSVNGAGQRRTSIQEQGPGRYQMDWPSVGAQVVYRTEPQRFSYDYLFTNTGSEPIEQIGVRVFVLDFPARPLGGRWFWGYTQNAEEGAPAVIAGDWGSGKLAVCAYEVENPQPRDQVVEIQLRGPNSPSTRYPVTYTLRFPTPLQPGQSARLKGSLRFAPSGTPTPEMANEVYAAFLRRFPSNLNWPDRRPIGVIFLANSGKKWETNPRGWFNDPKVDVTTPEGLADFRRRMMELADRSIAIMRDVGAQGMIFWDVEGGEMPHAITYLGDPRVLPEHAPEMDAVADEFFKRFLDAGFKTGVTLRPSRIVTRPTTGQPAHQQVIDPIGDMSDKIAYAQRRWGSTIFYMDTNVTWPIDTRPLDQDLTRGMWQGDATLISTADMVDLARRHPDTLIFPEFPRFGYYSAVGIYGETRTGGRVETPEDVRLVYPDAMTVWKLGDVDFQVEWERLLAASVNGDVQVFRTWFGDWANTFVKLLQDEKRFLTSQRDVRLTGSFADQLRHEDALVRYAAVMSVDQPDASHVAELVTALGRETNWVIQRRMILSLGKSGSLQALPTLERFAKLPRENLDYVAMQALGTLGGQGTQILLDLLSGSTGRPRQYLLRALALNNDPAATPGLLEILGGASDADARLVIDALASRRSPVAEARMMDMLTSDNPGKLISACGLLGKYRSQAAVEPLVKLINRAVVEMRNNNVRVAAGQALEEITDKRYGPYSGAWQRAFDAGELVPSRAGGRN